MNSSSGLIQINLGWAIAEVEGSHVQISPKNIVFLSLKIVFVLANSVDPDSSFWFNTINSE